MSPEEIYVPCFIWGTGVNRPSLQPPAQSSCVPLAVLTGEFDEPRSVMDVAPTIAYFLGAKPPGHSMGQVLAVEDKPE